MATIEIDRPYLCFGDDGALKAFDEFGNEMKGDDRNLGDILADKYGNKKMKMEMETIQILKVDNNCCRWIYIPGFGWVCFRCLW